MEEVEALLRDVVGDASKSVYNPSINRFLVWLSEKHPNLIVPAFLEMFSSKTAKEKKLFVERTLEMAPNNPPVLFDSLSAEVVLSYLMSLKKANGDAPGTAVYNTNRSSIKHLFRLFGKSAPDGFDDRMSTGFRGLKRRAAKAIAEGEGDIKVGKDPLPFSLYRLIGKALLKSDSKEHIFAHSFMVICWNLMCRANNAVTVCKDHLEWREDALGIYFCQMKNDQTGERPRDPRHVYSNPFMPEICPILSLGLYWLCYPPSSNEKQLFPGSNQYDRFRKILTEVLGTSTMKKELQSRGMEISDIGTHSMRKGASTFTSSGSTACPSATAIHLRAGWALGGVQDRYLRYEAAGDMHVGRTVTGLSLSSPNFAILPPLFLEQCDDVKNALSSCFPGIPDKYRRIGEFFLASLVHHSDFLKSTLPRTHLIFRTTLFRDVELLARLKEKVVCRIGRPDDRIATTGVPPHISLLAEMVELKSAMTTSAQAMCSSISMIKDEILNGVINILEERAIGAGTVTFDGLQNAVNAAVSEGIRAQGITELVGLVQRFLEGQNGNQIAAEDNAAVNPVAPAQHVWNGRQQLLPENFEVPKKATILIAWQYWCCGDPSLGYPPLFKVQPSDICAVSQRKRFSEFKFLMSAIQRSAEAKNIWKLNPTIAEANEMFESCVECLHDMGLPLKTEKERTRRFHQMSWSSAASVIRKYNSARKRAREESGEENESENEQE